MNRSVVVTGAARGVGLGIAQELLARGWAVVALDRDAAQLALSAKELGVGCTPCEGDVTRRADLEHAAALAEEIAPMQGWVNNAGIEFPTAARELDEEVMREIIDVNLVGTLLGTSVAVTHWLARPATDGQRGAIVNVSSIHAGAGFPDAFVYAATKGAIDALTRQVSIEEGPHGIRANAVRPGAVMTPLTQRFIDGSDDPNALLAEYAALHPQNRLVETREVGAVVAFLLSTDAAMVSGQSLGVDGGASARVFAYPPHA